VNTMQITLIVKRLLYLHPPLVVMILKSMNFVMKTMNLMTPWAWKSIGGLRSANIMLRVFKKNCT
jgi:hypothetical protein